MKCQFCGHQDRFHAFFSEPVNVPNNKAIGSMKCACGLKYVYEMSLDGLTLTSYIYDDVNYTPQQFERVIKLKAFL